MSFTNEPNRSEEASAQNGSPPVGEGNGEIESLKASLAAAEAKAAEHRDLYMRALAELDNVRKRATRDIEQAHKFALEPFAGDLVAVKDSLELGLQAAGTEATAQSLLEGMEATLKLMSKSFQKAGVAEIVPLGEPFNPQLHEAMVMQPSPDQPSNSVLQVIQKGYQLNGRLLRPARVIVAK